MKLTWKESAKQYGTGETLFAGKWPVGEVFYDGLAPLDGPKYKAVCRLPGLPSRSTDLGNFYEEERAQDAVERIIELWMKGLEE